MPKNGGVTALFVSRCQRSWSCRNVMGGVVEQSCCLYGSGKQQEGKGWGRVPKVMAHNLPDTLECALLSVKCTKFSEADSHDQQSLVIDVFGVRSTGPYLCFLLFFSCEFLRFYLFYWRFYVIPFLLLHD